MDWNELVGSSWTGTSELWLDPLGNEAQTSPCTLDVDAEGFDYTWAYEGEPKAGRLTRTETGARYRDSWHQAKEVECRPVADTWALVDVWYAYGAGEGPDWGWRVTLAHRDPTGELVLLMDNIAPWGERGRAVRMTLKRA